MDNTTVAFIDRGFKEQDEKFNTLFKAQDEKINTLFKAQDEKMKEQIAESVNAAITTAMNGPIRAQINNAVNEAIATAMNGPIRDQIIAAVQQAMKQNEPEPVCTIGITDLLWPFRRFWIPICPKSWVDSKHD